MKPTISIIIPVYNVEKYLEKCLDSILVDNQFAGQVICVNDGSTDGSLAILEEYAERVESGEWKVESFLVINQPNAGLSAARNTGLRAATEEYVMFVDSDDWLFPNSVDKVCGQIDREDVIYFNAKVYNEECEKLKGEYDIPELKNMDGQAYFAAIYGKPRNLPFGCVWGGVYKRRFLIDNNLYNEPGIYHEDIFFTPQVLLKAKNVGSINEYIYVYRIRKGSITSHVTEKHIRDMLYVVRNLYAKYEEMEIVAEVFYQDICNLYINLIYDSYMNGISVHRQWRRADCRRMLRCSYDGRSRKISKLTCISPTLAYQYMQNILPNYVRKLINRMI